MSEIINGYDLQLDASVVKQRLNEIPNIILSLENKVDKDGDKTLTTNNFDNIYKNKVDNIEFVFNKESTQSTIDSLLSDGNYIVKFISDLGLLQSDTIYMLCVISKTVNSVITSNQFFTILSNTTGENIGKTLYRYKKSNEPLWSDLVTVNNSFTTDLKEKIMNVYSNMDNKVDKITDKTHFVYGEDSANRKYINFSTEVEGSNLVQRYPDGGILVNIEPIGDDDAVSKKYVDDLCNEKVNIDGDKVLSDNNFTDNFKNKITSLPDKARRVVVLTENVDYDDLTVDGIYYDTTAPYIVDVKVNTDTATGVTNILQTAYFMGKIGSYQSDIFIQQRSWVKDTSATNWVTVLNVTGNTISFYDFYVFAPNLTVNDIQTTTGHNFIQQETGHNNSVTMSQESITQCFNNINTNLDNGLRGKVDAYIDVPDTVLDSINYNKICVFTSVTDIDPKLLFVYQTAMYGFTQIMFNALTRQYKKRTTENNGEIWSEWEIYSYASQEDFTTELKSKLEELPTNTELTTTLNSKGKSIYEIDTREYGIYDYSNLTNNAYINASGELITLNGWETSDYVLVYPNHKYTIACCNYLTYYNENKEFINGDNLGGRGLNYTVTIPLGCSYIRFSYPKRNIYAIVPEGKFYPILPMVMFGTVGKEFNIYFDGLGLDDYKKYQFYVYAGTGIGKCQEERFTYIPETATTKEITIIAYYNDKFVGKATTTLIVKDTNTCSGLTKKLLVIGDSTIAQNVMTQELLNLFTDDVMNLTLLGTHGVSPNLHEGQSGWSSTTYTTVATSNPFWNSTTKSFDFSYYMTAQNYTDVNYVIINLGINDIFNAKTDDEALTMANTFCTNLNTMITSIHAFNSNIKIGLNITIPPSYSADAFGKSYGTTPSKWRYRRGYNILIRQLIAKNLLRYTSEKVYLLPINSNIDTEHNMQQEEVAVNSRNPLPIIRQKNGVHPADYGYYQIADTVFYWLKFFTS